MQIKAILFDLGGTLVNTPLDFDYENLLVGLHHCLLKNGVAIPFDEYKKRHAEIRDRIWSKNSLKEVAFTSIVAEALNRIGYSYQPSDRLILNATEAFMDPWVRARTMEEDVPSVLSRLTKAYKLGVVSNYSCSSAVRKTLDRFNVSKFFDVAVVSVDVGWRKPSPKIFRAALRELDLSASETVFVGDELDHDVDGAKRVGMRTVWLKKPTSTQKVGRTEPDGIISKLGELFGVLRSLTRSA
jgi:putative hydrolase of the HAD superfamily